MRYQAVHPRKVRGVPIHETMEMKMKKMGPEGEQEACMVSIGGQAEEFVVPAVENFVETDRVRQIKNRVLRWIDAGYPPHIVGPTGCGKTTIALAVAEELYRPILWINGDDQMTTSDLIGGYSEVETSSVRDRFVHNVVISEDRTRYTWIDNPLTIACRRGYTLIYNEFSRAKPVANNVLLSVLEEGILELPIVFGVERYVKVHPDFNIIFTSNSIEYAGVHTPQDALLDRMVDIHMDYYDFETEVEIVTRHTGIPPSEAERIVEAVRAIRDRLPEASKPGTRAAIMIGHGLATAPGCPPEEIREIYLDVLASKIGGPKDLSRKADVIEEVLRAYGWPERAGG